MQKMMSALSPPVALAGTGAMIVVPVRMPVEGGGWLGCYCSWKCVRDDIPEQDEGIVELLDTSGIRNFLVDYFENKIREIGVYDRPTIDEDSLYLTGERELTLPEFYEKQKELYENNVNNNFRKQISHD